MSMPTAKDLLAQADRLMRQRAPEELPVLTDLVIEEIELTSLSDRMDHVIPTTSRPSWMPVPPDVKPPAAATANAGAPLMTPSAPLPSPPALAQTASRSTTLAQPSLLAAQLERSPPVSELFAARPRLQQDGPSAPLTSAGPNTQTAMANVREKFNEQLLAKLEELQHSVFSQVMQKLEIHSAGSLKTHLREKLDSALVGMARELAEQVAEDTATQVRQIVSEAVDAEIARLREHFLKKRF